MNFSSKSERLCSVDFPIYCISMISSRHVLVAGGGGSARTGVKNGFEIFELIHDGVSTIGKSVFWHSTDEFAVMSLACSSFNISKQETQLAVGLNEKTQILSLKLIREKKSDKNKSEGLRQRQIPNGKHSSNKENKNSVGFKVSKQNLIQTDFNVPEPYQKVVRLSPNFKFMATGGYDGVLRLWTFPEAQKIFELEAHSKEIDDLDFSPDNSKIASVSQDSRAFIWDVKKGKKHAELGWETPKKSKYLFKRLRFGKIEKSNSNYKLFTIVNSSGSFPSILQRWNTKSYSLEQGFSYSSGTLSALSVSDNGNFVATGSMMDGTVDVFTAFNLKRVHRLLRAHSAFITGLEFLCSSQESEAVRGFSEVSLLSVSIDNKIIIHHIPKLRHISIFVASLLITIFLIGIFILCSYLGI